MPEREREEISRDNRAKRSPLSHELCPQYEVSISHPGLGATLPRKKRAFVQSGQILLFPWCHDGLRKGWNKGSSFSRKDSSQIVL